MKFIPFFSLVFPAFVLAQEWGPAPAPAAQPPPPNNAVAAAAASNGSSIVLVTLGQDNGITFTPDTMSASPGDVITFVVSPQSQTAHGVVESTADAPCTQRQGGFDSGLVNPGGNFSVLVNSSSPIYLFCPQFTPFDHCTNGMVMIINPSSSSAINSFESAASTVQNEATATVPASVGVDIVSTSATALPSSSSGASSSGSSSSSSSGSSPSPTTNGALENFASVSAALLTALFAFVLA